MTKILFVTYGGGHVAMVVPVVRELARRGLKSEVLGLTTAASVLDREQVNFLRLSDFPDLLDDEVRHWGERLLKGQKLHAEIDRIESLMYHGLSFRDLMNSVGEAEALRLFAAEGRRAFHPVETIRKIIKRVQPAMVVATSSPRMERASLTAAKGLGIPTLAMVDLFGIGHLYPLEADYLTVLSDITRRNLEKEGVTPKRFFVTGNPAFDRAISYKTDSAGLRAKFPSIPAGKKTVLWADLHAYLNDLKGGEVELYSRTDDDIDADLHMLAHAAAENDVWLMIRPHPSQSGDTHRRFLADNPQLPCVFAGGVSLYDLLASVDVVISYSSTVILEAALMGRGVLQFKFHDRPSDLPLFEMGLSRLVNDRADVSKELAAMINGERLSADQTAISFRPAAPQVVDAIVEILESQA